MGRRRLALFLPDQENPYCEQMTREAVATGVRLGFDVHAEYAQTDYTQQVQQVSAALAAPQAERILGALIMPIQEKSASTLAERALGAGVGWVFLNRTMQDLAKLRRSFPKVPATFVTPDQHAAGAIQGRQLLALLPQGGGVICVQGRAVNTSAQVRLAALKEVIQPSPLRLLAVIDGNWTRADTQRELARWLRLGAAQASAVCCQSDHMALGALDALDQVAKEQKRPELKSVLVLGCDGVENVGRKLVDEKRLAATVVLPTTASRGVELLADWFDRGTPPPEEVVLPPSSYPPSLVGV